MTDQPNERRLPGPDDEPRDRPPNANEVVLNDEPTTANPPGDYNPIGVGPNSSDGFGNTHVADPFTSWGAPPPVSPWSGWPNGWQTPAWNATDGGLLGQWAGRCDVVFAALDLNASILAAMPPYIVKGVVPQPATQPWLTNPEPLAYVSWAEFMKEMTWCYIGVGEVFIYATARYADGYPQRFMMLNPAFVTIDRVGGVPEYRVAGEVVDSADILHIKYASWPGDLHGHGPLEAGGARLLAVSALTKYATNLATSGGLPPAVLKYPRRVTRAQMRQMQADWIEARSSAMGVPAVLADGTELDVLNPQLQDTALAELSKFSEARISTLLGVPPFLLGLPSADAGTYVNSTNVFDFHWRASLRPKGYALMAALSGWLLPRGTQVELDRDEYTRPGLLERTQAYTMLIAAGVLTPQMVQALEHYSGSPELADAVTDDDAVTDENDVGLDEPDDDTLAEPPIGAPGRPTQTNV